MAAGDHLSAIDDIDALIRGALALLQESGIADTDGGASPAAGLLRIAVRHLQELRDAIDQDALHQHAKAAS